MAREFGSQGSLTVDTPSLLQRRDAIMGMANETRTERNLFKRTFRELNRRSRRGDTDAGFDAIKLYDMAQERGVEMTGIPSADQGYNAGAMELRDQQEFNAEMQGLTAPRNSLLPPSAQTPDRFALRPDFFFHERPEPDNPWPEQSQIPYDLTNAPNETITTHPQFSDNPIVGGEAGIEVQRNVAGPSAAQGGMLGAARRASTPLWSSRYNSASDPGAPTSSPLWSSRDGGSQNQINSTDLAALDAAATPMNGDDIRPTRGANLDGLPQGFETGTDPGGQSLLLDDPEDGPPRIGFGETLDQQFRRKYPNSSRLMDRMSQSQSRPPLTASLPSPQGVFQYPPQIGNSSRLPGRSSDGLMRAERLSRTV